ncbi:MAG TPA: isochorismatase family protein [Bryobacteraceae bacterium]|nr:isochorismatase family protein [Bryobacteraceae bacterium]
MKVFFDIDTQLDFMVPAGALYGRGAEDLIPTIAALNRYAGAQGIPLISTADAHPEDAREFREWPPHCVAGTFGQHKPSTTLLSPRVTIPWDSAFDCGSLDLSVKQIVVEKNDLDVFSNPNLLPLLEKIGAADCYVYGVFIDYCVSCALMGLVRSSRRVSLITDAAASIDQEAGERAVGDFVAAGGFVIQMAEAAPGVN